MGSHIRVQLMRCEGEDYCKSKEEIDQFLRGKYMLLYMNRIRFQSNSFGEASIIKESLVEFMGISS